jgi:hypothetical protein
LYYDVVVAESGSCILLAGKTNSAQIIATVAPALQVDEVIRARVDVPSSAILNLGESFCETSCLVSIRGKDGSLQTYITIQ